MKKTRHRAGVRGATMAEVMIVLGILGIIGTIVLGYGCRAMQSGAGFKKDAEDSARKYGTDMNIRVDGVSCGDTPNAKGMVYCSLNSGGKIIPLACIGSWKVGNGCRPTTVTAPGAVEP